MFEIVHPGPRSILRKVRDIGFIVIRYILLPTNFVIAGVFVLLMYFGDTQEGVFMAILLGINVALGIAQEVSAWAMLERLESLMAPRIHRIDSNGLETQIFADEIRVGDRLQLRLGDQMPADGIVVSTNSFAVNEALITGESSSFSLATGDTVLAGSIVTSGEALMKTTSTFDESRIGRMTQSIKRHSQNTSPIQRAMYLFAEYMVIVLLVITGCILLRALLTHQPAISIVRTVGALAAIALPQGLVLAITLLFAYGANRLFKKNVILQEMNAIEKLGRIKNLCMDKTGTLTDNALTVEALQTAPDSSLSENDAQSLCAAYMDGSGDSSLTIRAVTDFLDKKFDGQILGALSFSSDRQYGAVHIKFRDADTIVVAGGPDIFVPYLERDEERQWLEQLVHENTTQGKRVFCVAMAKGGEMPESLASKDFSVVAAFVLENRLREGIVDTVRFFQDRGVALRIISGDNPQTVQAIADKAGFARTDAVILGSDMEAWTGEDYAARARDYTIFARIKPEQKEKIVEALKHDGFTAMVGDGANDALAIKRADLGIAMYDGSLATRSIASVVLWKNSFTDFPNGVRLADRIIESIEIFTSIFFNQIFVGVLFLVFVMLLGYDNPFTPLNMSFITYFIVVFPGTLVFSWVITSSQQTPEPSAQSYLRRMVPFPLVSSFVQAIVMIAVWLYAQPGLPGINATTLVLFTFMSVGYIYFLFTPSMYGETPTMSQRLQLGILAVLEVCLMVLILQIPWVINFFDVVPVSLRATLSIVPFVIGYVLLQYLLTRFLFKNGEPR